MRKRLIALLVCIAGIVQMVVGPPVDTRKKAEEKEEAAESMQDMLSYGRYLEQVVQLLEEDKEFIKKLQNVSQESIKSGDVAHELEFVNHRVRSKLDEAKRVELQRLRDTAQQIMEMNELGMPRDRKGIKVPAHLDYMNPHSFEIADLKKLMQTAGKDLEEMDRKRKEEFKAYEMEKEHQYREGLKQMNEEEKKAAEEKHKEQTEKHKDHPRVHHPGSKQQLEQVWEEQDHMPREEFDPNLFFSMHDLNGDNFLDEQEVEAILTLEIRKMYESNNTEDDPVEMMEEYHRMREHIYNEVDKNKDRMISKEEFLEYTKRQDFERDEGWKGLDEQQIFTEEELAQYEREHYQMQGGQMPPPHLQFAQHPQGGAQYQQVHPGAQYQHVPQQGGQYPAQYQQQGHPQASQYQQQGHPQAPQYQQQGHPQGPQYHQGVQYQQGSSNQGHPQGGQYQQGAPSQGHPQGVQYQYDPQSHQQFQQQGAQYHPQVGQPHPQAADPAAHHPPVPSQQVPSAGGQQNVQQPPAANQAANQQQKVNENKL